MSGPALWVLALLLYLVFWVLVNGVFALIVRQFPQSWFDPARKLYRARPGEQRLYRRLGIARWKDRLPECGWMTGFSKSKIVATGKGPQDILYLQTFITETCMAELGHLLMGPLGFLSLLLGLLWPVLWAVAALHLILQLALVVAQRFNRPRLLRLLAAVERKQTQQDKIGDHLVER